MKMLLHRGRRVRLLAAFVCGAAVAGTVLVPTAASDPKPVTPPFIPGIPALPGPVVPLPSSGPQGVKLLKAVPETGPVGSTFTLSTEGLPPSQPVNIVWSTWNGAYLLDVLPDNALFFGRQFDPVSVILGQGRTDASGGLSVQLKVPEDFGHVHDLYAVINGVQVAKGGFLLARSVTISPQRGPIGTPINVRVTGMGNKVYENTGALRYDNKYVGFTSATTTRGTAVFKIRAAGPVGKHLIEVDGASPAVPYLNIEQSPIPWVGHFERWFTVTKDNGPPTASVVFPVKAAQDAAVRSTLMPPSLAAGVSASLSSTRGAILSKVDVAASGLEPNVPASLVWSTVVGSRPSPSGWALATLPLGNIPADAAGSLKQQITIPDNLGGWHLVRISQNGKLKADLPYYVEWSLVGITPSTKLKAGQRFQVHIKGVGWTEFDNSVTFNYDNGYIGYACGFNSNGDIVVQLVATGAPGTHLIDLYPQIYQGGHGLPPWNFQLPMLTYERDHPGLALGYQMPAIHLAIEIVK